MTLNYFNIIIIPRQSRQAQNKPMDEPDSREYDSELQNELGIHRLKRSTSTLTFYKRAKVLATQMTKTLDKLVGPNYDSRIRPNYGGKPVEVELNLSINGMVGYQHF